MVRVVSCVCPRETETDLHGDDERRAAAALRDSGKRKIESSDERIDDPKRAKAVSEVAPCGRCVYQPGEERNECSVCLELRCKGVSFGTVCSECADSAPHEELYPGTDEHGRRLDPEKRVPLPTCKCGKVIGMMSPCFFATWSGDPAHSPLPNPPLEK